MKIVCILSILLSSAFLLLYPFVLMANIMFIGSPPPSVPPPFLQRLASGIFLWGSTLYPLVYLGCLVPTLWTFKNNPQTSLFWQAGLWIYLAAVVLAIVLWPAAK